MSSRREFANYANFLRCQLKRIIISSLNSLFQNLMTMSKIHEKKISKKKRLPHTYNFVMSKEIFVLFIHCFRCGTRCPTSFPNPNGLGATFNQTSYRLMGAIIGLELRALWLENITENRNDYHKHVGLDCWSPNINILRDPRWGRALETTGIFKENEFVLFFFWGGGGGGGRPDKVKS